jgi:hypothetical protein
MKKIPLLLEQVNCTHALAEGDHGARVDWSVEQLGDLCPDEIAIDRKEKTICILEYTRPSDTRPEVLQEAAA